MISQITPDFPDDYIKVTITARLKNYQSVTEAITFRIGIDEPALNISISFNGGSTLYYSGTYNSLPHYIATSKTFSYTINYPLVTSELGNTVTPVSNQIKTT